MPRQRTTRALALLSAAGGAIALVIAFTGSFIVAVAAGMVVAVAAGFIAAALRRAPTEPGTARPGPVGPRDPSRRRFLGSVALGGAAFAVGGAAMGRGLRRLTAPDPEPVLQGMAHGLGGEYVEIVRRTYHEGRSGDLQLVLAPFNSSNYANESRSLVPRDPRTSHASVWLYLERIPMLVWSPGFVKPGDRTDRVTLTDLAPTTSMLMGFDEFRALDGTALPGIPRPAKPPKVIVTFVIDGGGWNALTQWGDAWPNIKRLARESMVYRNAIHGSFPAVTACAHANIGTGAFPHAHGITGHNVRTSADKVVKAYGTPGRADPGFLLMPTLADLWSDATGNRAWIGELGYQIWHMGMIGYGGKNRPADNKPVGVFWDEFNTHQWQPHNPDLFRLPASVPPITVLEDKQANYVDPGYDSQFDPEGRQAPCCSPPIIQYQGDLIQATFDSEPVGQGEETSLLYINFKAPDYTGHIYNMLSKREEIAIRAVDEEIGRVAKILQDRFAPGEAVMILTADHGQCPLPDTVGGTRVDPLQLKNDIDDEFGRGLFPVVQYVAPSEVFLDRRGLLDAGVTRDDIAAWLVDYRYRNNIGPYVPRSAIEQNLLDQKEFAAVFSTDFIARLGGRDLSVYGDTTYTDADPFGVPSVTW